MSTTMILAHLAAAFLAPFVIMLVAYLAYGITPHHPDDGL